MVDNRSPNINIKQDVKGSSNIVAGIVHGGIHQSSGEQQKSLAEAAKEIQDLLTQLEKTYSTTTPSQQTKVATLALEEIEQDPNFWERVIGAAKAAGMEALREAVDNPVFNIMSATIYHCCSPARDCRRANLT
ncbi:MAG: hypothetical protein AAGH46_11945 [Bacteroidota bacterium]